MFARPQLAALLVAFILAALTALAVAFSPVSLADPVSAFIMILGSCLLTASITQAAINRGANRNTTQATPRNNRQGDGRDSGGKTRRQDKPREAKNQNRGDTGSQSSASGGGPREEGEVKWFNRTRGFGFIIRDSGGEIFVHQRSISGDSGRRFLRDGERVSFEVVERDKGEQAEQVSMLD